MKNDDLKCCGGLTSLAQAADGLIEASSLQNLLSRESDRYIANFQRNVFAIKARRSVVNDYRYRQTNT